MKLICDSNENRTRNPYIKSVVLCLLSYGIRKSKNKMTERVMDTLLYNILFLL